MLSVSGKAFDCSAGTADCLYSQRQFWLFRNSRDFKISLRATILSEKVAGGLGFEPRLTESESAVLPLDDPPR